MSAWYSTYSHSSKSVFFSLQSHHSFVFLSIASLKLTIVSIQQNSQQNSQQRQNSFLLTLFFSLSHRAANRKSGLTSALFYWHGISTFPGHMTSYLILFQFRTRILFHIVRSVSNAKERDQSIVQWSLSKANFSLMAHLLCAFK